MKMRRRRETRTKKMRRRKGVRTRRTSTTDEGNETSTRGDCR